MTDGIEDLYIPADVGLNAMVIITLASEPDGLDQAIAWIQQQAAETGQDRVWISFHILSLFAVLVSAMTQGTGINPRYVIQHYTPQVWSSYAGRTIAILAASNLAGPQALEALAQLHHDLTDHSTEMWQTIVTTIPACLTLASAYGRLSNQTSQEVLQWLGQLHAQISHRSD